MTECGSDVDALIASMHEAMKSTHDPEDTATGDSSASTDGTAAEKVELKPGSIVDHYELIRELGRGGMGTVYLARDTQLGRRVALKLLFERRGTRSRHLLAEARATALCSHENIVVIHEVAAHRGHPYMVLEYLEGRTLHQWLKGRTVTASRAAELMAPVVRALACAHGQGIVHRDLKPSNIIVTDSGVIKVLDFGIAKVLDSDLELSVTVDLDGDGPANPATGAGKRLGTRPYMSPEQWNRQKVDHRSDLWSVGIMLYEMVTGKHPLAPISWEKLEQVADVSVPMPSVKLAAPESGRMASIIDRCLIKCVDDRLGSASELLAELEAITSQRHSHKIDDDECPYAGLAPLRETDSSRFFGRSHAVMAQVTRLREQPLLAIVGPSGVGKSSFVRAGIIPALQRSGEAWKALAIRPGRYPINSLASLLLHLPDSLLSSERSDPGSPDDERDQVARRLRAEPGYLGTELRARARRKLRRIVLFVDQCEELYTLATPEERAAFTACLEGAADDPGSPLRVILCLRSDFIDQMARDPHLMVAVSRALMFLPPMGRDGLREALVRPLEEVDYRFESQAMIGEILDELADTRGALPLLQFTATKLWELRDRNHAQITEAAYRQIGGVAGVLATHADAVMESMTSREQSLAKSVLLRLVTPERTRAIASLSELSALAASDEEMKQVVARLADARLLVVESDDKGDATVEIVHESLIERWPALIELLDENREDSAFLNRLRHAAREWQASDRAEGLLWRDDAAKAAELWYRRYQGELASGEKRYLGAVFALAKRSVRRRRRTLGGLVAALVTIAAGMAYLAWVAQSETRRTRAQAVRTRDAARMVWAQQIKDDPTLAMALVREVEEPESSTAWSTQAALLSRFPVSRTVLGGHTGMVRQAIFSPDGRRVITASFDHTARVWNADGTGEPIVLAGHRDSIAWVACSPDSTWVVTASADHTARVWNVDGSGEPVVLRGHSAPVLAVGISPGGERIVTASADKTARLWSADGVGSAIVLRGHQDEVVWAEFSPDGTTVLTASMDHTARIWNADGSGVPIVLAGHTDKLSKARFSPDGKHVATVAEDETLRVWNADGSGEPVVWRGHTRVIPWVAFSPDGKRIVTASWDGTARVWNVDGTGEPVVLRGHTNVLLWADFTRDGKRVVTTGWEPVARIWNADGTGMPRALRGHSLGLSMSGISPDGTRVVTASYDKTARVWDIEGTAPPITLPIRAPLRGVRSATRFLPDGERLSYIGADDALRVINLDRPGVRVAMRAPTDADEAPPDPSRVPEVDFSSYTVLGMSRDGDRLLTAAPGTAARVWRTDGSGEYTVLEGHAHRLAAGTFSPDGSRVVTVDIKHAARTWKIDRTATVIFDRFVCASYMVEFSPDGESIVCSSQEANTRKWVAYVWSVDGSTQRTLTGHTYTIARSTFSPDGRWIATASHDKTARVWSADGSGEPVVLRGHEGPLRWVAFSPDGDRLVTTSEDNTARIWAVDDSVAPIVLRGHSGAILAAEFSPDGRRVVTASADGTVRVWSADGSGLPIVLAGHTEPVVVVRFSPNGTRVLSLSHDKTARIWTDVNRIDSLESLRDKLWRASNYCVPLDAYGRMLGVDQRLARKFHRSCMRRVGRDVR